MTKSVLVCLATGSEELEATTVMDLLGRAGLDYKLASLTEELVVTCARGVRLLADAPLAQLADGDFAAIVLPGGIAGGQNFANSTLLVESVRQFHLSGRLVAAICASPARVLVAHKLFPQANMTGFPGLRDEIPSAQWQEKRVCFDARYNLLTSQGPGTSMDFALKLIDLLAGKAKAAEVAQQLVLASGIYNYQD